MTRIWLLSRSLPSFQPSKTSRSKIWIRHASRSRAPIPAPFPVIDSCPLATCACRPMPEGLDIDVQKPLNGSMAPYAQQILICTGKDDWSSRIEDDEVSVMAHGLKALFGRGGKFSDPYHNVMITNSSFQSSTSASLSMASSSAFLLPSFRYLPEVSLSSDALEDFAKGFVLPTSLHQMHAVLSEPQKQNLLRDETLQHQFKGTRPVQEALVLICGHNSRDTRCGILGPVLRAEFEEKIAAKGLDVLKGAEIPPDSNKPAARVGLISHVGGHKFAGNVIIYVPPSFTNNALAGTGIWYGRVRPEHVEGIVSSTLLQGRVIKELFRGGVYQSGRPLFL